MQFAVARLEDLILQLHLRHSLMSALVRFGKLPGGALQVPHQVIDLSVCPAEQPVVP